MAYSLKIVKYDIALEVLKILSKIVTVANTYYLFLRYFLQSRFGNNNTINNYLYFKIIKTDKKIDCFDI